MKKFLVCICLVALAVVLPSAKGSHALEFKETTYDFGNIADTHAPVVHEYEFVNVADEPVAVLSVSTGCGSTRPEYPAKPIDPGKSGKIKITFLPAGQRGDINKDIKVRYRAATARSSKRITLRLNGHVTPE